MEKKGKFFFKLRVGFIILLVILLFAIIVRCKMEISIIIVGVILLAGLTAVIFVDYSSPIYLEFLEKVENKLFPEPEAEEKIK